MEDKKLLLSAYDTEGFKQMSDQVLDILMKLFPSQPTAHLDKTIPFIEPEKQYEFWNEDFHSGKSTLPELTQKIISHSLNLSNKRNVAHQLSVTLPICMLTAAISSRLNNVPTHYQLGMTAISMERIIIEHLLEKFEFSPNSTGTVVTGGSMGNLTSLLTARTKYESFLEDPNQIVNFAIMVSEVAHYSIERAAMVMGLKRENVIQLPINPDCTVKTDVLEEKLQEARSQGKIVFCIVGCASTTSHGAHDDLTALGNFARKHNIWFHIDGAHGGCAIFSDKYKHLLKGVQLCDSIIIDFHKMLLVPTTSTAILFNKRPSGNNQPKQTPAPAKNAVTRTTSTPSNSDNFKLKPNVPSFTSVIDSGENDGHLVDFDAPYLFNDSQSNEWYEGGYHTLECSKPTVIFHTYAIFKVYGDEIFKQNVDALYDMGIRFGELIEKRENIKLALKPQNNIVCFRYLSKELSQKAKITLKTDDFVNQKILDRLVIEGNYYLSSAPIFNVLYLRVTIMNPFTDESVLNEILDKVEEYGKIYEAE